MEEHFPQTTASAMNNFLRITVVPKEGSGNQNIWRKEVLEEIIDLDERVRTTLVSNKPTGDTVDYENICDRDKISGDCDGNPVLKLIGYNTSNIDHVKIFYPFHPLSVATNQEPIQLFVGWFLGGVTTNENGDIATASHEVEGIKSMSLIYRTDANNSNSQMWEDVIRDKILEEEIRNEEGTLKHISLSVTSTTSFDNEIQVLSKQSLPYLSLAFVVLLTFSVLVSLSSDWIIAKVSMLVLL